MDDKKVVILDLQGEVPSKKNLNRYGKHGVYRVKPVQQAIEALELQARMQWRAAGMDGAVEHPELQFSLVFAKFSKDRDNAVTTILDVLQAAGVLVDDNANRCNGVMTVHPAKRGDPSSRIILTFPLTAVISRDRNCVVPSRGKVRKETK